MENILEKVNAACNSDQPNQNLEQLVLSLSGKGFSRQEIYEIFHNIKLSKAYSSEWLELEEKNSNHHPLDNILDRLGGFCNPKIILLRHEPFVNKEKTRNGGMDRLSKIS